MLLVFFQKDDVDRYYTVCGSSAGDAENAGNGKRRERGWKTQGMENVGKVGLENARNGKRRELKSQGMENAGNGKRREWKTQGMENAGNGKHREWKTQGMENAGNVYSFIERFYE